MSNFLSEFFPTIKYTGGCGSGSEGSCSTNRLEQLSNFINPIASVSELFDPVTLLGLKTTASFPSGCDDKGFLAFFKPAITSPTNGPVQTPTPSEWATITDWLQSMNDLITYYGNHDVLSCMLEMLCECNPEISVLVDHTEYDPNLPASVPQNFANTTYSGLGNKYIMVFNFANMYNYPIARTKEYIIRTFRILLSYDLTLGSPASPLSNSTYYFDPYYFIGYIVHELGHIIDSVKYKAFYPSTGLQNTGGSHVHAIMWQSFYFMEFFYYNGGAKTFGAIPGKGDFSFLDYPGPACSNIKYKLDNSPKATDPLPHA